MLGFENAVKFCHTSAVAYLLSCPIEDSVHSRQPMLTLPFLLRSAVPFCVLNQGVRNLIVIHRRVRYRSSGVTVRNQAPRSRTPA
jgi:hypothetical protein